MTERQVSVLLRLCRLAYWIISDLARYLTGNLWGLFQTGVALGMWSGATYGFLDLFAVTDPQRPLSVRAPFAIVLGICVTGLAWYSVWNPLFGRIEAALESPRLKAPTPLERKFLKGPETPEGGRLTVHED